MMLFKRALLEAAMESDIPVVIFADEDKIPYAFNPSKCYSICDSDLPWEQVCKDVPLAIACAFRSQQSAKQLIPSLMDLGLTEGQQESDGQIPWCVVAGNAKFLAASRGWFRSRRLTVSQGNERPSPHLITET